MKQDPNVYDNASGTYSELRYSGRVDSYIKYLFTTRQKLVVSFLKRIFQEQGVLSVFEVGCADATLFARVLETFPGKFSRLVGVDISEKMLDVARHRISTNIPVGFYQRGEEPAEYFDLVVETGVHIENLDSELNYLKSRLVNRGYIILSLAARNSLYAKFKLQNKLYVQDYLSFKNYEEIIKKHFEIIEAKPYCIFVPKLWLFPDSARFLQPFFDAILARFVPELFHEKLYLLRVRS